MGEYASENYWQQASRGRLGRRRMLASSISAIAGGAALGLVGCSSSNNNKSVAATATRATTNAATAAAPGSPTRAAGTAAAAASTRASTATPAAAGGSPAASQPKRGGTFALNSSFGPPANLDPHLQSVPQLHAWGVGVIYSRLLKTDPTQPYGNLVPIPDLAEKWEQASDTSVVFHIRPNAKWQNIAPVNGRPVTADDVAYSYQRQIDSKVNASLLNGIDKITAVDAQTLRIDLKQPNADLIVNLADGRNRIVAKEAVAVKGDLKEGPNIGSGPWILKSVDTNGVILNRNPDYYISGRPYLDTLQFYYITDPATEEAAFRQKKVLTYGISPAFGRTPTEVANITKDISGLKTIQQSDPGGPAVWVRFDQAPTNDIRFRQAINFVLDRDQIIKGVEDGKGFYTVGISLPSNDFALPDAEAKQLMAHDVNKAKSLMSQSGNNGWSTTLTVYNVSYWQATGEIVQQQLQDIGFKTTIQTIDSNGVASTLYQQSQFTIAVVPASLQGTTNNDLYSRYYKGGSRNGCKLDDPQLNQLIDQQAVTLDANKRKDLLLQVQRRIAELSTVIRIYGRINQMAYHPVLQDWHGTTANYGEDSQYEITWLNA